MFKPRDLYQLTLWTRISIKKVAHIITISNHTKEDIVKEYGESKSKITLAYPGYDDKVFKKITDQNKIKEIQEKYQTGNSYIIYMGTIQPRKNLVRLIEAFSKLSSDYPSLKLVIVGKTTGLGRQAWMFEETLEAPQKFRIEDRVIFTGFAPTE